MLATLAACSCLVISIRSCRTLHIITLITNLPSSCHESLTAIKFSNSWCIYFGLYINYWQQREPTIGKPHLGTPNANCSCIFAILSSSIHSLTSSSFLNLFTSVFYENWSQSSAMFTIREVYRHFSLRGRTTSKKTTSGQNSDKSEHFCGNFNALFIP